MNEQKILEQVEQLRTALMRAKEKLVEQDEFIQQLSAPPLAYAVVIAVSNPTSVKPEDFKKGSQVRVVDGPKKGQLGTISRGADADGDVVVEYDDGGNDFYRVTRKTIAIELLRPQIGTATVAADGKFVQVLLPKKFPVNPGDSVTVSMQTMQIVDVAPVQFGGNIGYLRRVVDQTFSEVDYESSVRVVFNGKFNDSLEKGDRLVLDSTGTVIIRNLGKEDERFSFSQVTNVTWDQIGGLTQAKQQMIEVVELPHRNPDIFKFYGKKPVKGVLLYGPPGCGKTMLGKATASSLAKIYNGDGASAGFIYIKGPEILDRYVGVAEATIRQIFARARKHKDEYGYPAVIFIDEADAILGKRGSGISSDVEKTIVPMFLTEMDGLEESGALVVLATNRADILDPAVVRDGRIDRKIKITRPDAASAVEIFNLNLKQVPLNNGYTHEDLSKLGSNEVFSPLRTLYKVQTKDGAREFTLGNIVNGGMIASIVDQATSIALQRDLSKKRPEGLCKDDLVAAVNAVEKQNRDLNHTDELSEFVHDFREEVVGIHRLRQSASA